MASGQSSVTEKRPYYTIIKEIQTQRLRTPLALVGNLFVEQSFGKHIQDAFDKNKMSNVIRTALQRFISAHNLDVTPEEIFQYYQKPGTSQLEHVRVPARKAMSSIILHYAPDMLYKLPIINAAYQAAQKQPRSIHSNLLAKWMLWYHSAFLHPDPERHDAVSKITGKEDITRGLHITHHDAGSEDSLAAKLFDNYQYHDESHDVQIDKSWNRASLLAKHKPMLAINVATHAVLSPMKSVFENSAEHMAALRHWGGQSIEHYPVSTINNDNSHLLGVYTRNMSKIRAIGLLASAYLDPQKRKALPESIIKSFDYIANEMRKRGTDVNSPEHLVTGFLVGYMPKDVFSPIANATEHIANTIHKSKYKLDDSTELEPKLDIEVNLHHVAHELDKESPRLKTTPEDFILHHKGKPHIYGSSIFGPKVGAFAANFLGNAAVTTIDTWMLRALAGTEKANKKIQKHVIQTLSDITKDIRDRTAAGQIKNKLLEQAKSISKSIYGNENHAHKVIRYFTSMPSAQAVIWAIRRDEDYPPASKHEEFPHEAFKAIGNHNMGANILNKPFSNKISLKEVAPDGTMKLQLSKGAYKEPTPMNVKEPKL